MADVGSDDTEVHASASARAIDTPGDSQTLVPGLNTPAGALVLPAPGYTLGEVIGRGGMGEVVAARDLRIGREVAVKRMRADAPSVDQLSRFLREARIQARLDHPAIVPVHELGMDAAGLPYFTMKRLTGATLSQRLGEGMPQARILRAFVEVCLAIEFAHARGYVHRDLKPSNIMLGDYGETYVIDWGIARVIGDEATTAAGTGVSDIDTMDQGTQTGAILGTPGYMAPEQIRGHAVTEQADIYSLGAILFEILTGEPLHPRGQGGIGSTLGAPQASAVERTPERAIAPELDAIAFHCLAELPERRPTAHELAERVQAFLDGDRDVAQRHRLAAEQLAAARVALEAGDRALAMRHAGRATALHPESVEAGELLSYLVLQPPAADQMPPALAQRLAEADRDQARHRSRNAQYAYVAVLGMFPLLLLTEIQNWWTVGGFFALVGLGAVLARMASKTGEPRIGALLLVVLASTLVFTRFASPFVLTPTAICIVIAMLTPISWIADRPKVILGWATLAVLLPFIAEWVGLFPPSWWIENHRLIIDNPVLRSSGQSEAVGLIVTNFGFVLVFTLLVSSVNRQRRAAERSTLVQAWHLEQLMPSRK